ncbi:FxsB family cyclophane-forming radical SAM/SPASM peptide maturase [Actinoplanes sp. NPDC026670]|uniref:FxsB family cyclophane-forming radical SAM/SPASM peptide maturase n=1 Tax=Actinoplanes sp. NPDC026670 TaxID=3154700 RepID=UPI0033F43F8F
MSRPSVADVHAAQRRAAPWPYAELDLTGPAPHPVRDVVLKVHQRCNLACDYCYVYELADRSWRDRPAVMPDDVWQATLAALGRHARRHGLDRLRVILHGGEPLLLGPRRLGEMAAQLRAALPDGCRADIGVQSNGTQLSDTMVATLARHGIRAGISLDGVPADHDRHRVTHNGRGTSAAVAAGLRRLQAAPSAYAGVLCTVSPDTDPVATYAYLREFEPPLIDFLLPHANWTTPPAQRGHGDWLVAAFDAWYGDTAPPRVRLFDDLLDMLFGGAGHSEQAGLSPIALAVIETDGAIELVDSLKSAYDGAARTGLDIRTDELDDLLTDPGYAARQLGTDALAPACRACPVQQICGGGHYVHRYRAGAGFRNPSVYCADMLQLIGHIHTRVTADLQRPIGAPS